MDFYSSKIFVWAINYIFEYAREYFMYFRNLPDSKFAECAPIFYDNLNGKIM